MSKAFTNESDDEAPFIPLPPLPAGVRNYITSDGAQRIQAERNRLVTAHRQLSGDDFETRRRRQTIDRQLEHLNSRMQSWVIVEPPADAPDQVRFGMRVSLEDSNGDSQHWRIVGVDEVDLSRNAISWLSPLATALLGKRLGEEFVFQTRRFKVTKISD